MSPLRPRPQATVKSHFSERNPRKGEVVSDFLRGGRIIAGFGACQLRALSIH